jgi:nucleoside-diphosphate-sugar epimerase
MKNALVTGGAGFIGSNLIKLLLKNNFNVTVIDNLSSGNIENIKNLNIQFIQKDLQHINNFNNLPKFNYVFHLAASVGRQKSIDFPLEDSATNLMAKIGRAHV